MTDPGRVGDLEDSPLLARIPHGARTLIRFEVNQVLPAWSLAAPGFHFRSGIVAKVDFRLLCLLILCRRFLGEDVRYFIRSTQTRKYFHAGQWTLDSHLAQAFPDRSNALDACFRYHLTNVELVLQVRSEPSEIYDLHMPLA